MFRRLYRWVLSWADTPFGSPALFVMAFTESSFFPIPPDVLQIALSVSKPHRAFWYATVSLAGSILGAFFGYYIGYVLWQQIHGWFIPYIFTQNTFDYVQQRYADNAFGMVFLGASAAPVPYKVFTITAGVCELPLLIFFLGSLAGRVSRFYLVAVLFWFYGPSIKDWIDKHLNKLAIVFTILLVGGFIAMKRLL